MPVRQNPRIQLMFVSDDSFLVGDGDRNIGVVVEDNTLTSEAAFEPRVESAVNKVLLFVGYFLQVIASFFHVNVAGRAGANAATNAWAVSTATTLSLSAHQRLAAMI